MVNFQTLLDDLNRLIDSPIKYNRLIMLALQDFQQLITVQAVDGVPVTFDFSRGKTLSVTRVLVTGSIFGNALDQRYLKIGEVPAQALQGFYIPRDATITGLWAKSRSLSNWSLEVRKNGVPISIASVAISSGAGAAAQVNIDINAGDTLQLFANGSNISHIIGNVELAWRFPTVT